MRNLYPEIESNKIHNLKVSDVNTLYIEESGNPKGKPLITLHGGPGSHSKPKHRRFYNPKKYRIIMFDQRGCGQSKPFGELRENTIWNLVEDMEKIRKFLRIEKWHVSGGSWGSTLALAYAETYPKRVKALILRGIFTFRKSEIKWLYGSGANKIYPDTFEQVYKILKVKEWKAPISPIVRKLLGKDRREQKRAAIAWGKWERSIS